MTPILGQSDLVTIILYAIVGIIASARITRLVVADDYPLIVKARVAWDNNVRGLWNKLLHCHWCFAPWATLLVGFLAWLCDYHGVPVVWFIVFGWLAASYLASMVVQFDEG
jgi:hypothetical protein